MGTLASQAEIGVRVQALGEVLPGPGGITPSPKKIEIIHAKPCNIVHFDQKMFRMFRQPVLSFARCTGITYEQCTRRDRRTSSGSFVSQEQWERWRVKWKLAAGSKHWRRGSAGVRGYHSPPPKKILQYSAFWPDKMVRIAVHNILSILTMERCFHAFPLEMTLGACTPHVHGRRKVMSREHSCPTNYIGL